MSAELARRYADQGIVSTSLHPGKHPTLHALVHHSNNYIGYLKTDLHRHFGGFQQAVMVHHLSPHEMYKK